MTNSTMGEQVTSAEVLHIANKYSVGNANAYSDHDPYVVMLDLSSSETAIREVESAVTQTAAGYYNLAGQRIEHPMKGIYIIGGKKVIR